MSDSHYEIRYSGTSATVTTEFFPRGSNLEVIKSIARDYKADLWKGFISLREVKEIDISIPPVISPTTPAVPSV